jgi:hypothetical protein
MMNAISWLILPCFLFYVILGVLVSESKRCAALNVEQRTNSVTKFRTLSTAVCVYNESQLRRSVKNARRGKKTSISLCTETITLSAKLTNGYSGIDVSNKIIDLRCQIASAPRKRCQLNGDNQSRIFFGNKANFSAVGINFVNGTTMNDSYGPEYIRGGALRFTKSSIYLDRTSLLHNSAGGWGGAVYMEHSSMILKGGSKRSDGSIFEYNVASNGGALYAIHSKVTADVGSIIFKNNYEGAIMATDSTVSLKNVNFYLNTGMFVSIIWFILWNS